MHSILDSNLAARDLVGDRMSASAVPSAPREPIRESLRIAGEKDLSRPGHRGSPPLQRRTGRYRSESHA